MLTPRCATFTAAEDIQRGKLTPEPRQSLPPLLFLMLVYTAGIPGIPFVIASVCGWGMLMTTLITHLLAWESPSSRSPLVEGMVVATGHGSILAIQMFKLFLFNLFGTFVGIEQTRQMRLNFWHVRLLQVPATHPHPPTSTHPFPHPH